MPGSKRLNEDPSVSVVIPSYNRAHQLPVAVRSALAQGYPKTEIIVVDDGSTDETQEVLAPFRTTIKVVRQENAGAASARNHGIRISRGDIVAFLDSDDVWLPSKLARQVEVMKRAGRSTPCCLCNTKLAHSDGRVGYSFDLSLLAPPVEEGLWLNVLEVLATRFILFNQAVAVRRDALLELGGFDENCTFMEDYDLALRLALIGPWTFIRTPLVVWNEGTAGSLSEQAKHEPLALYNTVLKIYEKVLSLANARHYSDDAYRSLRLELKRSQFRLRAITLCHMPSQKAKVHGLIMRQLDRTFDKLYTISPWYPRMQISAL